jgi:thiol-disulfide isomerase/thioredoxin
MTYRQRSGAVCCVLAAWAAAWLGLAAAPAARAQSNGKEEPAGRAANESKTGGLELVDLTGYRKIVAEHRGQPLLVSFWATWCEPCQAEFPLINQLARKYGPKGLAVVGISLDQEADLNVERDFLKKMQPVFPSYRKQTGNDDAFIRGIAPDWDGAIPATAFYSRDGRLAAFTIGESSRSDAEKTIEQLLAIPAK